jgi:hypothetical protein
MSNIQDVAMWGIAILTWTTVLFFVAVFVLPAAWDVLSAGLWWAMDTAAWFASRKFPLPFGTEFEQTWARCSNPWDKCVVRHRTRSLSKEPVYSIEKDGIMWGGLSEADVRANLRRWKMSITGNKKP